MNEKGRLGFSYTLRLLKPAFLPFLLVSFFFVGTLSFLGLLYLRHITDRVEQEVVWDVAEEVARGLPTLSDLRQGSEKPQILNDLLLMNPELELFVLDARGTVVFPRQSSDAVRVSLDSVRRILQPEVTPAPVYGDDPRDPAHQILFAAAPLLNTTDGEQGFVYLVLRSRLQATLETVGGQAEFLILLFLFQSPFLLLNILLGLGFALFATRHFRRILTLVRTYSAGNLSAKWRSRSNDDMNDLGLAIQAVAREVFSQQQDVVNRERLRKSLILEIAHDVLNPLMGISTAIAAMISDAQNKVRGLSSDLVAALSAGASSMSNLASTLQQAADLDTKADEIHLLPIDLLQTAEKSAAQVRSTIESRGLKIRIQPSPAIPEILGDAAALERVFLNLIDNAARHTDSGGEIVISLNAGEDATVIAFSDNGVGIAPDELPFIFDRFFRGSRQNLAQGAGVGLATVRRLISLHGGSISVDSILNQGSTFSITLPHQPAVQGREAPPESGSRRIIPNVSASRQEGIGSRIGMMALTGFVSLIVLFVLPRQVNFLVILFFTVGSTLIGLSAFRSGALRVFIFTLLIYLGSYAAWWQTTERPILSLIPVSTGLALGSAFASFLRSPRGKRSFIRIFYLSLILNGFSIGWTVHILHTIAEEELTRFVKGAEREYAHRLAGRVSSIWCSTSDCEQDRCGLREAAIQNLQALNQKLVLSLPEAGIVNIERELDPLEYLDPAGSRGEDYWSHSLRRKFAVPRRHLAVKLPLPGCAGQPTLIVAFFSNLFDLAFKNAANSVGVVLAIAASVLAFLLSLAVAAKRSWPHDGLLREIQSLLSNLPREQPIEAEHIQSSPLSQPIVGAVSQLISQCEIARQEAEQSDQYMRNLALLAAREYGEFARIMQTMVSELQARDAALDPAATVAGIPEQVQMIVRKLESVVTPEILLTRALFQLARLSNDRLSRTVAALDLAETIDSVVCEQIGILEAHGLMIRSIVPEDITVISDPDMLRMILSALFHGLTRSAPARTVLLVEVETHLLDAVLRIRPENADGSLSAEGVGRLPLGLFVACELCKCLDIPTSLENDPFAEGNEVFLRFSAHPHTAVPG